MGVKPAAAYLVASGFRHYGPAETGKQRAYEQHAAAERRAFAYELVAFKVVEADVFRPESVFVLTDTLDIHPDVDKQLDEVVHVEDVRNVAYPYFVRREQ